MRKTDVAGRRGGTTTHTHALSAGLSPPSGRNSFITCWKSENVASSNGNMLQLLKFDRLVAAMSPVSPVAPYRLDWYGLAKACEFWQYRKTLVRWRQLAMFYNQLYCLAAATPCHGPSRSFPFFRSAHNTRRFWHFGQKPKSIYLHMHIYILVIYVCIV